MASELKYGHWEVIGDFPTPKKKPKKLLCKCTCGVTKAVAITDLKRGVSRQCKKCSHVRHGMYGTAIYRTWISMLNRCNNKNSQDYKDYGGRGITVCDRWRVFENFYEDMGEIPANFSIERVDNNGGYSPENCIWADYRTQTLNKRNSVDCKVMGEKFLLSEVSQVTGIPYQTLYWRVKKKGQTVTDRCKFDEKTLYNKLKELTKCF